ncbi:MAG TPA: hypothetical protein VGJ33_16295 [Candidatus Angelobacter sp.]|jgi:hypothetical protein
MKELTYTQLVVIRVTHTSPGCVKVVADVIGEELAAIIPIWLEKVPAEMRPDTSVFSVGRDEFPGMKSLLPKAGQC